MPRAVFRFPPRLRVISSGGIMVEDPRPNRGLGAISRPKIASGLALDALLSAGTIDARQHVAALVYRAPATTLGTINAAGDTVSIETRDEDGRLLISPAG